MLDYYSSTVAERERVRGPAALDRRYDTYFPSAADRANAVFVAVAVARINLWIRGVTPEPFGLRTTILERDAGHGWRVISDNGKAA